MVLVPFDIGVVYIINFNSMKYDECFSPLRYWGSLYLDIRGNVYENLF